MLSSLWNLTLLWFLKVKPNILCGYKNQCESRSHPCGATCKSLIKCHVSYLITLFFVIGVTDHFGTGQVEFSQRANKLYCLSSRAYSNWRYQRRYRSYFKREWWFFKKWFRRYHKNGKLVYTQKKRVKCKGLIHLIGFYYLILVGCLKKCYIFGTKSRYLHTLYQKQKYILYVRKIYYLL